MIRRRSPQEQPETYSFNPSSPTLAILSLPSNRRSTRALFEEAQIDLGNLDDLLDADPALASFASALQPIVTAANNDDLNGMLSNATSLFDNVTEC